ncbi:response regulator [Belliella marina]|uniref:Response regulator n=1 Tax=Belliella marina TaxID=1644146 RepID=A0ABW4VPI7_9BACT
MTETFGCTSGIGELVGLKKVLLVEDNEVIQFVLEHYLKSIGVEVVKFLNGEDAWDYWKSNKDIDLIITDIMMPKMNGVELAHLVRTCLEGGDIPIIAVSASAQDIFCESHLSVFNGFIRKPFTRTEFMLSVQKYLK